MSMRTLILVALVVPTLSLVGCDDETSKPTKDGGADGSTDGSMDATADANVPVYLPSIDELPEGKWSTLVPGGDTVCSRGTPYKFYVYRGTSKNLVVDYMGGGACWNSFTCKASSGLFDDSVETNAEAIFEGPDSARAGLFDMTDERNPVKTYTHVIIPYCTGDVHWGDATQTYGEGAEAQVIHHNGAKNSQAVLDWVYENVVEPEVVLTTGCSAGAYGAALWSAHVMHHYTDARNVVLADSGAGVITSIFFGTFFPNWNATASFPTWLENFDLDHIDSLPDMYNLIGAEFPSNQISQFNTVEDGTQKSFYQVMGGTDTEWSEGMLTNMYEISNATPNFNVYLGDGAQHCIIPRADFYTRETDNVKFVDWVSDMLDGTAVDDVRCETCQLE